ncbi:hypothetical protein NDU88_006580, partial [Pleurodeles waltl]
MSGVSVTFSSTSGLGHSALRRDRTSLSKLLLILSWTYCATSDDGTQLEAL